MDSPHGYNRTSAIAMLLIAGLAASCIGEPLAAGAQERTLIVENGEAQVIPALEDSDTWIQHDLWVETEFDSDGDGRLDRMHVDVTRPGQTESDGWRVPAIYETSPYYAGTGSLDQDYFWDIDHEVGTEPPTRTPMPSIRYDERRPAISRSHVNDWIPRGFAVVHSESPGTGLSQGCPSIGGSNETLAPKAIIDWLNGRARGYTTPDGDTEVRAEWSNGNVGMTGTSYNGGLAVAAATTGVEGLRAIIPVSAPTSWYEYYRSNGLVRSPGGYAGEDVDVLYDFINSGQPDRRAYCDANFRDRELADGQDRVTGDYNTFWDGRDYLQDADNIQAAVLVSHAFNDWNVMPGQSLRLYDALKARGIPAQVFFHQGGHGGSPSLAMMNRWFTRYVLDIDNGVENDPRAWIVREGPDAFDPTPYADFPNPDAVAVTLHPIAGGERNGGLTIDSASEQGVETLVDDVSRDGGALARAATSPHRLIYATPPLQTPVHISGVPTVRIRIAADRSAANLSVWLVSLPWADGGEITDNIITRSWADPQNHDGMERGAPLVPGMFYDVEFPLQPDDQIIPAGQRIGLMIFSSDQEFTLHPEPGTRLSVDLDGTTVQLPVVGGEGALGAAIGSSNLN